MKKRASGGPIDDDQTESQKYDALQQEDADWNKSHPDKKKSGGKVKTKKLQRGGRAKKEMRAMGGPAKSNLGKPVRKSSGGDCYADGGKADGKWIQSIGMKKGALHKELGVPQGEKIPEKKLDKAAHSNNPLLAKRASLAKTLKGLKH